MVNHKDEHLEKYITPILHSNKSNKLIEESAFEIWYYDDKNETVRNEVIEKVDVESLILSAQIEATVLVFKQLITDEHVVMSDSITKSFAKYINDLTTVMDKYE